MIEHIKTGSEIKNKILMAGTDSWENLQNDKWVSLPWLKEQVEEKKKTYEYVHYKRATSALEFVLSLLEEEESKVERKGV